jgi:hypothetical protein
MGRRVMHAGCRWENQKERDNMEDLEVGGKIVLKCNVNK